MRKILSGSDLAGFIKERQAKQVRMLRQAHKIFPKLAIVTDSNNPVVATYIALKRKYGADILIDTEIIQTSPGELSSKIESLNSREDVQGIIVQLPIQELSKTSEILSLVSPEKDVDGLNPAKTEFTAATPTAINWLLAGHSVNLNDKNIAIVGRGRLVGAPLEAMWQKSGLKVSVFQYGDDLNRLKDYNLIVTATGSPELITSDMVSSGAVVVDAGTASDKGRIVGDVSAEVRLRKDVSITPEKGGVGPLTVAALFDNLITACLRKINS